MKYYVVWEGRDTGVFTRWADCKRAIDGYPKAKYKSFLTEDTARKAFIEGYEAYWGKQIDETLTTLLSSSQSYTLWHCSSNTKALSLCTPIVPTPLSG